MKLLSLIPLLSSTLLAKPTAPDNEPFVMVQAVHAPTEPLVCDGSASNKATVTVEVDLEGAAPEPAKIKLTVYFVSFDPYKGNWVSIDDTPRYVFVKRGKNTFAFNVRCGPELQNGIADLGACVLECPNPITLPQSTGDMRTWAVLQVGMKKDLGKPKIGATDADKKKVEQAKKENNK